MAINLAAQYTVQNRHRQQTIQRYAEGLYSIRRSPLLPRRGTYSRDLALWRMYYGDRNLMARSAFAGQVRKIQSTPWEIKSDSDTAHWQSLLWNADFGGGWDVFLSRVLLPYFRADIGGFIEIIGPGNPSDPLIAAPIGVASLNSLNCVLTGDMDYPIVYTGASGWHKMHRSRVVQVVDSVDSDFEGLFGYGDCAFARYASAAQRDETMAQYIEQYLDDKPRPGITVFKNISQMARENAMESMLADLDSDERTWGRTLLFEAMQADQDIGVSHYPFSEAPEKFDYERYTELNVKLLAMAMGTDIQEIWELTGGGIGTGTQSQVLAQKAKGKSFGRLLKLIERIINGVLPREVEFEFKYEDSQEDLERAQTEEVYARIYATVAPALSPAEQREYLANQLESVRDAMRDAQHPQPRLTDDDLQPTNVTVVDNTASDSTEAEQTTARAFEDALTGWQGDFVRAYNATKNPLTPSGLIRMSLLRNLQLRGDQAYREGMKAAGVEDPTLSDDDRQRLNRWFAEQTVYMDNLLSDFQRNDYTREQLNTRASLWEDKSLRDAYYEGVDAGTQGGAMFKWKRDAAKESCVTCVRLDGQIHRYATYKSRRLYPGSSALACWGGRCGCDLELQPPGTKAVGNIRAVPFVRGRKGSHHHAH